MILLSLALMLSPAEAGKNKSAKTKREAREAKVREHMLDEPIWEVPEGNEDRATVEDNRAACAENDMAACTELGKAYALGEVTNQDFPRSVALLQRACDAGEAPGCTQLGLRYIEGQGVFENRYKAARLFGQSCNAGDMEGCMNLGVSYALGLSVDKDLDKAFKLFGRACDAGNTTACKLLKDYKSAKKKIQGDKMDQ